MKTTISNSTQSPTVSNVDPNTKETTTMQSTNASTSSTSTAAAIPPPPPVATIPVPPTGFVKPKGGAFGGVMPTKAELVPMTPAVTEVTGFVNWTAVFGTAAPAQPDVAQAFDVANKWAIMRAATKAWADYCVEQEGIAWTLVRSQMTTLKPFYTVAAKADPSLDAKYPNFATVLHAKKKTARKGVATKAANKAAAAKGEPPTHGAAGKKRKRTAANAALAAQEAAPAAPKNGANGATGAAHS